MKNPWIPALIAIVALPAAAQVPRIAVLDFSQISQNYTKSKARFDELKADEVRIKAELTKEYEGYKVLVEQAKQIEKQFTDAASNPAIREAKQKEAKELLAKAQSEARRLQGLKQEKEAAYHKRYAEVTEEVLADIQNAAAAFAKEKGIDLLFDRSGRSRSAAPIVQLAEDGLDVTSEFLARLNQQAPVAAAPAAKP